MAIPIDSLANEPVADRLAWRNVFTSDGIAEPLRYQRWRDTSDNGIGTWFDTTPDAPFAIVTERLDLGAMQLGWVQATSQYWWRGTDAIARDDGDALVVNVRHAGAARGDMAGRDMVAPSGSIVLVDLAQTQRHCSETSECTGFVLPRAVAERMMPSVRDLHGHVIPPDQAALLVSHLAMLRTHASYLAKTSGPAIAQTIIDLFAVAVTASTGSTPVDQDQHERGLACELRAIIEQHLGSPSLNIARLSRTLGVSRSTLYRLLQEEGGVQAYIRTRRLARIAESLRTAGDRQTIAALAERWGFCDAAYLGRAFREAYGVTPGEYRACHHGL